MAKSRKTPAPFPSRDEIIEFIQDSPGRVGKREIARAFNLSSEQKTMLKQLLKELEADGVLQRGRGRRFAEPGTLPEVTVVRISGVDMDGELLARPETWDDEAGPAPVIYMSPERRGQPALGVGDRALTRLKRVGKGAYEGRTIRRLPTAGPSALLGIYRVSSAGQGRIEPTDRRVKSEFVVPKDAAAGARSGELVRAEVQPGRDLGLRRAKVVERLGSFDDPRAVSLVSIHQHEIPLDFPAGALEQAAAAGPAKLGRRTDLRQIPLVTIDGADARDFDDAVFAEPDDDPKNKGGWHLIVAIADVAWYVRPGDALDRSAYERGNSVYFPDRVVPMLPHELSTGWCSLNPKEDRPCLAAHLWIGPDGNLKRHTFVRGLMRSAARLTYTQVQEAHDGRPDDTTGPILETVIEPLYAAYAALAGNREKRGVLDLDLPERQVVLNDAGQVAEIVLRERFDSHRLIEEFMITANVAAAEALEKKAMPCMYRVHDQPSPEKISALAEALDSIDVRFNKGQVPKPSQFNGILHKVKDTPYSQMVQSLVLRSQAQAEYAPENIGHFGLALRRYCHFTSPIRRYSDLLVHRALIRAFKLGDGGLEENHRDFKEMGEHISSTERRAMVAERDAVDRYTAAFLADRVGASFTARVNGVTRFGLFVTLDETGADGLIPIGSLPDDYYIHDEARHLLKGRSSGRVFRLGEAVEVTLAEARPVTGGMIFRLMEGGTEVPARRRSKPAKPLRKGKSKAARRGKGQTGGKRKPTKSRR